MDIKKEEVWYFRCCMPWKWCARNRNWYEGKTALEIAKYKVEQEENVFKKKGKKLPDEHAYKQVLELLENPPAVDHGKGDDGRTDNDIGDDEDGVDIELMTKGDSQKVIGNAEDNIGLDMVAMDVDHDDEEIGV